MSNQREIDKEFLYLIQNLKDRIDNAVEMIKIHEARLSKLEMSSN